MNVEMLNSIQIFQENDSIPKCFSTCAMVHCDSVNVLYSNDIYNSSNKY